MTDRNRAGQFVKGHTSSTKGRKKRKSTLLAAAIGKDRCDQLIEKIIDQALNGCTNSQKLLVERLWAVTKSDPLQFAMPEILTAEDLPLLSGALLKGVADGAIPPHAAAQLAKVIEAHSKSIEVNDQARQIERIQEAIDVTIPEK